MDTPTTPVLPETAPVRTRLIPRDQDELSALLTRIAQSYATAPPRFVLAWKTPAQATILAQGLATLVGTRIAQDAERQSSSGRLGILTRELDKGATQVKAMINEEWEADAEAESHYSEFGLVAQNGLDRLPLAQQKRVLAINDQLLPALLKYGMGSRKYGTAWWTPRLTEYETLTAGRQDDAQEISGTVGDKAPLLTEAPDFLTRLDALLFANTRTEAEYLAERRAIGFLKEYN